MNNSVGHFAKGGLDEDGRMFLKAQAEPYVLELLTFSVHHETSFHCPSLTFYFVLEKASEAVGDRYCPFNATDYGLPPTEVRVLQNQSFALDRTAFVMTHDMLTPFLTFGDNWIYRINMEVRENAQFRTSLQTNFITQDISVFLNYDNNPIATALPNSEGDEDFEQTINGFLQPGVYQLQIRGGWNSEVWSAAGEIGNSACAKFSLEINLESEESTENPHIIEVFPNGDDYTFDPSYNLRVRVSFDHLVDTPTRAGFSEAVIAGPLIYLTDLEAPNTKIAPKRASLSISLTSATVYFSNENLAHNHSYSLQIDAGSFKSGNQSFTLDTQLPVYHMRQCDCSGRGHCDDKGVCQCDEGYTGRVCGYCKNGYHASASTCVADIKCPDNFCGSYGNCTDTKGYPECVCKDGYVSAGSQKCMSCAYGYVGFPDCALAVQEGSKTCDLPLLPVSLNGPGYLGFDGSLHLSGRYYLDVQARRHTVLFTVKEESLVRVYVEPHAVDVDLSLRQDLGNGNLAFSSIASSFAFNEEETIFTVVPPGSYGLTFSYILSPATTYSSCESAMIETVVKPSSMLSHAPNNMQTKCSAATRADQLFSGDDSPWNGTNVLKLEEGKDVLYKPDKQFQLPASDVPPLSGRRVVASRMIYAPLPGKLSNARAQLNVEIAYNFESGDLGMVLEESYQSATFGCNKVSPQCLLGNNGYDRNSLSSYLQPGKYYTLWIYEPIPQNMTISKCSIFQLSMEINWRQAGTSDELGCPGSRMPNAILDTGYGMHWADRIALVPRPQNTTLFVGVGGARLRFSLNLNEGDTMKTDIEGVDIMLWKDQNIPVVRTYAAASNPLGAFLTDLSAGSYTLQLRMSQVPLDAGQETAKCRFADVEFAYHMLPNSQSPLLSCPTNDVLPNVPSPVLDNGKVQYELSKFDTNGALITYYTLSDDSAAFYQVSFTVNQDTVLIADFETPFLDAQGVIQLYKTGKDAPVATSVATYNNAKLHAQRLDSGNSFVMKIALVSPATGLSCVPFHFSFKLVPAVAVEQATAANPDLAHLLCETLSEDGADYIPRTLNSWRWLNRHGRVDFHSDRLLIPAKGRLERSTYTTSTVKVDVDSVIRLQVKGDRIQSRVQLVYADNSTDVEGASTKFGRVLSHVLKAGTPYIMNWTFINWRADPAMTPGEKPFCEMMEVHLAIRPVEWLEKGTTCANSVFPTAPLIPDSAKVPSQISPFFAGDTGSYKISQSDLKIQEATYKITLDSPSNVLIELEYDFAAMDLQITLRALDKFEGFSGDMSAVGSSLLANGLTAGRYSLTIRETSRAGDAVLGCRPFTFRLVVERDEIGLRSKKGFLPIPDSLNDVGYLGYDGAVHFAHEYQIPNVHLHDQSHISEFTNFTVQTDSVLRVLMRMAESDKEEEINPVLKVEDLTDPSKSTVLVPGMPQLLLDFNLISNHNYRLSWYAKTAKPGFNIFPSLDIHVWVELSIQPVGALQSEIALNADYHDTSKCTASFTMPDIKPDTSQRFMYKKDDLVLSMSDYSKSGDLGSTRFGVLDRAVFYAVLEAQFPLSHMTMVLRDTNSSKVYYPLSNRNTRYLQAVIPAGVYEFALTQDWYETAAYPKSLDHCLVFSLHIITREAWQGTPGHIADCSGLDLLPWNLSNPVPFGKPMDKETGALVMYGDQFLYPERNSDSDSYSFMYMNLPASSLHVVLFFEIDTPMNLGGTYSTDFDVVGFDEHLSMFEVRSYSDVGSRTFRLGRFHVEAAVGMLIQLSFTKEALQMTSGTCPYFTFASYALETGHLKNKMLCTESQLQNLYGSPSTNIALSEDGTYYEHSYGAISSTLAQDKEFVVTFTLTQASIFHFAVASNAFVSTMSCNITRDRTSSWTVESTTVLPAYEDHLVNQRLVSSEYLPRGNYVIRISHFTNRADLTNDRGETESGAALCMPWSVDMWISPFVTDYCRVIGVNPATLYALRSTVDLVLEITMDQVIYDPTTTNLADFDDLKDAFSLQSGDEDPISPSGASSNIRGLGVNLVWKAGMLTKGKTYKLQLKKNRLQNNANVALTMFSNHSYTVISNNFCGAHGHLDADELCACDEGYGGSDCSVCGVGYVKQSDKCVKTTAQVCQPCSCGCDNNNKPLGDCDDTGGIITCHCQDLYTGPLCNECKDSSQNDNYPLCVGDSKECPLECIHGVCDRIKGVCKCTHFWTGDVCDVCPEDRFEGNDCDRCKPRFAGENCELCSGGWTGDDCKECSSGWSGDNCEIKESGSSTFDIKYVYIGVAAVVLIGAIVLIILAVRRWKKKRDATRATYAMTSLGGMTDSDDFFDDNIDSTSPHALLGDQEFNLHLSDDEF